MRSLPNGHIQETVWSANAAKSRRYSSVSSMRSLPNGHIQETVGCANAAKSRRYSRVKVVPFQAEGFPTRPHPAALVGRTLKAMLSLQMPEAVLWIRIQHFKWIRIRFQGFDDQKLKKYNWQFLYLFFISKIAINLSLGLHKGRPSYRRSLHPSNENIQHFTRWNLLTVLYFSLLFLPSRIRIHNIGRNENLRIQKKNNFPVLRPSWFQLDPGRPRWQKNGNEEIPRAGCSH